LHGDELIGLDVGDRFLPPAGPYDLQTHDPPFFRFTEAEGQWHLALREIARTGFHHLKKADTLVGLQRDFGADTVSVRFCADSLHLEHIVLVPIVISKQPHRSIVGAEQQVKVTIVVKIAVSSAAADNRLLQGPAQLRRDFLELIFPFIAEEVRRLRILHVGLDYSNVVGHMAIHRENVEQTVEIVIKEK